METTTVYGWFEVLAGAYRGRQMERRMVLHAARASADGSNAFQGRTLCGYDSERLSDEPSTADSETPECPKCAEKLARKLAKEGK